MKKLLIHSNNTAFNRVEIFPLAEQFVFDLDQDKDVDHYIDEKLKNGELKELIMSADVIFLKVALSDNYLEYLGIRLAYHIRLTRELGAKTIIPIVFIGDETVQFLGLTYSEPSILLTNGVYFIKDEFKEFQKIIRWYGDNRIRPLADYSSFLKSIVVNAPSNYQSHHSIANEWALIRYFSMFDKDLTDAKYNLLNDIISKLDYKKTLHYKFSEASANRENFNSKNKNHVYTPEIKGINGVTIGIIDDEIDKGWLAFYDYWFGKSSGSVVAFDKFKKGMSKEEIYQNITTWLKDNAESANPIDVFLIDLRLHDDDFSIKKFDQLTGVRIIQYLKKLNPGIQIVVSTASNKVWNYQYCLRVGVSNFAIKESPETVNDRQDSKEYMRHLAEQVSIANSKSFLANVYRKIAQLKRSNYFIADNKFKEFNGLVFQRNGILDRIFTLLEFDGYNPGILNQCLLLLFQILENYCHLTEVSSFGAWTEGISKLQAGHIWTKDRRQVQIFVSRPDAMYSRLQFEQGRFGFQIARAKETITSFKTFESPQLFPKSYGGVDATTLAKIISVLHFRDDLPKEEIERIILLRYLRSNVAAHFTGNVKLERSITNEDLEFMLTVIKSIFQK